MQSARIILVDDHPLMTSGLKSLIEFNTQHRVVEMYSNGEELLKHFTGHEADLIMIDIHLPGKNGIEVTRLLKAIYPKVPVAIVSMYAEQDILERAQKSGANGFIPKQSDTSVFIHAIDILLQGEDVYVGVNRNTLPEQNHRAVAGALSLTKREIEIVKLIRQGYSTKEISEQLHLSNLTVQTHRKNICKKLNVNNPLSLLKAVHDLDL